MAAGHYKLDNLVVIVDRNGFETDGSTESILGIEPLAEKLREVVPVDLQGLEAERPQLLREGFDAEDRLRTPRGEAAGVPPRDPGDRRARLPADPRGPGPCPGDPGPADGHRGPDREGQD